MKSAYLQETFSGEIRYSNRNYPPNQEPNARVQNNVKWVANSKECQASSSKKYPELRIDNCQLFESTHTLTHLRLV